jgi:hypothetical protein
MAHQTTDNTPYKGEEKLVIAIDMGTTHSTIRVLPAFSLVRNEVAKAEPISFFLPAAAISYVYLYPGDVPEVKMVRFRRYFSVAKILILVEGD